MFCNVASVRSGSQRAVLQLQTLADPLAERDISASPGSSVPSCDEKIVTEIRETKDGLLTNRVLANEKALSNSTSAQSQSKF